MSTVGAEQRLPPEVHKARRDATIAGVASGLTRPQIAATLGMSSHGYARWLGRHARDLLGVTARTAKLASWDQRRAAVLAADREGRSRTTAAAELGMSRRTILGWARIHVGPAPLARKPAPKPPPRRSMPVRVELTRHGWTVGCPRCQRWFVRPSRRAADKFAALHARCCSGGRE